MLQNRLDVLLLLFRWTQEMLEVALKVLIRRPLLIVCVIWSYLARPSDCLPHLPTIFLTQ